MIPASVFGQPAGIKGRDIGGLRSEMRPWSWIETEHSYVVPFRKRARELQHVSRDTTTGVTQSIGGRHGHGATWTWLVRGLDGRTLSALQGAEGLSASEALTVAGVRPQAFEHVRAIG